MKITDTVVSISKEPNQKVFWKDDAADKSGVSYSGFHTISDKGSKDGGRFDEEKFNRFIDLRITIFGKIGGEHESLKSLEKLMVKDGKLLVKREKAPGTRFYHELTINEWERYDGRSNKAAEETTTSPAAQPAQAAAGTRTNPFARK